MNHDVFVVLAAVASADGKIDADELVALERAAQAHGADLASIRAAAAKGVDALDLSSVAASERLFVYAMAYWMSRLDGDLTEDEDAVLLRLGQKLTLADEPRMNAEAAVDEVAAMPAGSRPDRFDLDKLHALLAAKL
jgi:tellurite resistance protein